MASVLFNIGSSRRELLPTEAAYVAGFLDGEGCLTIGRARRQESRAGFSYEALMTIANTDLGALKAIAIMCGNGKIQVQDKRSNVRHKPLYRLLFTANQIRHLLPQLRRYLLVKGRQADVLMEFLGAKVSGRNVTPALWQRFENLRSKVRALNLRGIKDVSAVQLTVRPVRPMPMKPTRPCSHADCLRKHFAKGYCFMHYRRLVYRPERRRLAVVGAEA